jgi:UDP-glucose:glycoprotein glucosyltransferase
MIPSGGNLMWINGVQIDQRQIDAFSLLDHLRRERKLIEKFRGLGLSAQDTVKLLSHPLLAESHADVDSQRYDYRDELDGGEVIIWLNNLEKDSRYQEWPTGLEAYIQSAYPGQLPPVARDLQNVVVPVDLSKSEDILLVLQQILTFIKRGIPVRFGLVPTASSPEAIAQLKVAHYLQDTFGLSAFIQYLEEVRLRLCLLFCLILILFCLVCFTNEDQATGSVHLRFCGQGAQATRGQGSHVAGSSAKE